MADKLILKASNREVMRKNTRFLRRKGITPTHLFGHSIKSQALQCDTVELQHIIAQAGMTRPINLEIADEKRTRSVLIREIQKDVVNRRLLHVDFYQVRKGEKIRVEVPIVLVGEAPAMKTKGRMLTHGISSLHLECLPDSIPAHVEVDISPLEEVEQALHIKDILLSPEITVHADPEQMVVKISEARVKEAVPEEVPEEVPAEAAAEVKAEEEAPPAEETEEQAAG